MNNSSEIIKKYKEKAIMQMKWSTDGNSVKANKCYRELKKIYILFEENVELKNKCLPILLDDKNPSVSCWAAAHCLGLNVFIEKAIDILQIVANSDCGANSTSAEYTLLEYREKGHLVF